MKRTIAIFGFLFFWTGFTALKSPDPIKEKIMGLEEAIKKGWVKVRFKSLGGFQGNCMQMAIQNLSGKPNRFRVEPGRRLVSDNEKEQDIFIVKELVVFLEPGEFKEEILFGFCCQSHNRAPGKNSKFDAGYLTDSVFIELAEFISWGNFENGAIQSAVWTFSDGHPVSAIFPENGDDASPLIKKICELKGIEIPWYRIKFQKGDSLRPFSNKPERLTGKVTFEDFGRNDVFEIKVVNSRGAVVKKISNEIFRGQGTFETDLDLNISGWKRGDYEVLVYAGESLRTRMGFKI